MKTLHILACCLFLAAIAADLCGKCYHSRAMRCNAELIRAGRFSDASARADAEAAMHTGNGLVALGMVTAAIGLIAWLSSAILAKWQGKRVAYALPLAVFVAYVLLFCVMV